MKKNSVLSAVTRDMVNLLPRDTLTEENIEASMEISTMVDLHWRLADFLPTRYFNIFYSDIWLLTKISTDYKINADF